MTRNPSAPFPALLSPGVRSARRADGAGTRQDPGLQKMEPMEQCEKSSTSCCWRIQDKQDLDLERDPALRHSPAIMHQESGFLGTSHAISNKQASSPELQGTQRELGREVGRGGKKKKNKLDLSVYQPKNYIKWVCKEATAKTGMGRKKMRYWNKSYTPPTCRDAIQELDILAE